MGQLQKYLEDKTFVAFDTETTGVTKESEIIGFSVAAEINIGYYVVLSYWQLDPPVKKQGLCTHAYEEDKEAHGCGGIREYYESPETGKLISLETKEFAKEFIEGLKAKSLIMQNSVFDCSMVLNSYGIDLMPSVHTDTLILGHLLNENRLNGLKERGEELYGESAKKEQEEMKASVYKNGGVLTKEKYELYKADSELLAKYGAKDAILTLQLFYEDVQELYEQGLDKFFYEDESMPLMRGPTYDLNTTGLKVDPAKLQKLKGELEAECLDAEAFILNEIKPHIAETYPGTNKSNKFNINSGGQLSWLLFLKLGEEFAYLTDTGKDICKALGLKTPYTYRAKMEFLSQASANKDQKVLIEKEGKKKKLPNGTWITLTEKKFTKIRDPKYYLSTDVEALKLYAGKYQWVQRLLEYKKAQKLLSTYVEGIQNRMRYGIIHPSFLQHGTTSGRYSSRDPNFQNLPREDKRVKECIVARPGHVFVGADYAQLEPRIFASISKDERLMRCFNSDEDFYSVIGVEIFGRQGCSLRKNDPNSFAKLYPKERQITKEDVALATVYGTTANQMAPAIGKTVHEAQEIIDNYLARFPSVHKLMVESHDQAMTDGVVYNLFGRPRRMPEALDIRKKYGRSVTHEELPYGIRNTLNLAVNHKVQSSAASIMNRAAILVWKSINTLAVEDPIWNSVKIVLQVHDELVLEGPEHLAEPMSDLLKGCMETAVILPGVPLVAEPKIATNLADLK